MILLPFQFSSKKSKYCEGQPLLKPKLTKYHVTTREVLVLACMCRRWWLALESGSILLQTRRVVPRIQTSPTDDLRWWSLGTVVKGNVHLVRLQKLSNPSILPSDLYGFGDWQQKMAKWYALHGHLTSVRWKLAWWVSPSRPSGRGLVFVASQNDLTYPGHKKT